MKRHRIRMKTWLTTAVTVATPLALASSASAMRAADPGAPVRARRVPIAGDPSGLTWTQAGFAVAAVVALTLVALVFAYGARMRNQIATSH
jgi:hypothetical protein